MPTQRILTDDSFNFRATVESHGWCVLAPFSYDTESGVLSRVHRMNDERVIFIRVEASSNTSRKSFLRVQAERQVYPTDTPEIDSVIRRVLCVDWEMTAFYDLLQTHPGYEWVASNRAGRLMRSPMVWEDLVKTLLTTNTTWRQTKEMCRRLVLLGDDSPFGHTFPTPEQIAAHTPEQLAAELRVGYRGAYLHALAENIASSRLDVEAWANSDIDSATLYKQLIALKGFGDYAVASVMRLLGHHDRISIDSVCRDMFAALHSNGQRPTDAAIRAHYEAYGQWRGLVMWMDVLRDEYVPPSPGAAT
jgi:3-methyladenine DNA glycosylase/8-oxoguanine DNA glycosylase